MKIQYNFSDAKQRVIDLIKEQSYEYCTTMLKEIKYAAGNEDIDNIEMLTNSIRQVEVVSEEQIKAVTNANCISDILLATSDLGRPGNVLYEGEDLVLKAIFDCEFESVYVTTEGAK
jgi:hypothetical protein